MIKINSRLHILTANQPFSGIVQREENMYVFYDRDLRERGWTKGMMEFG
jgi:hypothetical protein